MATKMTKRGSMDNEVTYEHFCDTHSDMIAIDPSYATLGSIAIVLQDDDSGLGVYIANSNGEWLPFGTAMSGGGGSSSGPTVDSTILRI